MKVPIDKVVVAEGRHRKSFENIEALAESIKEIGLIHPIVVEKETLRLIAGERRLRACKYLDWEKIEVTFKSDLDDWTRMAIELEENLRRENLTYAEEVEAKLQLHELYQEKYGKTVARVKGGHTLRDTSELLDEAEGLTKMDIALALAIREKPELGQKDSKSAAYKAMKFGEELSLRTKIAEILAADSQDQKPIQVILGDSLSVLKGWEESSFDFAVIDPPYLVDIDESTDLKKTWDVRVDDLVENLDKVSLIFKEVYRVLRDGSHCYVFFASKRYIETWKMLEECGFTISPIPLIWVKSTGNTYNPYNTFRSLYEPIFYCSKGKPRPFTKRLSPGDVFVIPTPNPKVHPTEKPFQLVMSLVGNCSVEGEIGLDPFAGSGTFGQACQILNRRAVQIEKDPEYYTRCWEKLNTPPTPQSVEEVFSAWHWGDGVIGEVLVVDTTGGRHPRICRKCDKNIPPGEAGVIGMLDDSSWGSSIRLCVECATPTLRGKERGEVSGMEQDGGTE